MTPTAMEIVIYLTKTIRYARNIILIIGNTIIQLSSRRRVSKLLSKLPPNFFPPHRLVITAIAIGNNRPRLTLGRKPRRTTLGINSSTSSSDEGEYECCKHCHRLFNLDMKKETKIVDQAKEDDSRSVEVTSSVVPKPLIESSPQEVSSTVEQPFFLQSTYCTPTSNGIFITPPLRKITVTELTSIKLRPSNLFQKEPKTPEVHDMLAVLRRRYAAMHSPVTSDFDSFASDEDGFEDCDDNGRDSSFLSYDNFVRILC